MFDIGWGELVVIGIVALIVIGPKELPTVLRTIGQWSAKVRRMAAEFQGQFQEAMREAEFADLKKQVDAIGDTTRDLTNIANPLETVRREVDNALHASPAPPASSSAAPVDAVPEPLGIAGPAAGTGVPTTGPGDSTETVTAGLAADPTDAPRAPAAPEHAVPEHAVPATAAEPATGDLARAAPSQPSEGGRAA